MWTKIKKYGGITIVFIYDECGLGFIDYFYGTEKITNFDKLSEEQVTRIGELVNDAYKEEEREDFKAIIK